ncbi:fas-associated death domain protein [Drosophila grimshawi]|uniref:GH14701 n=1 Tax=Drosophila grimshawi TaxID=7222 RepID=B4IX97_DROGR|nr:fas-associated death domain protein [Drosophila grimshawi]EDV97429.1 GH14701 [Drosophila grimshawi]
MNSSRATGSHWSYDLLKQMVIEGCSNRDLNDLKELFASEIGTPRKMDRIKSVADLIDCLERSDQINEDNVEPLRLLGKNFTHFQHALDSYEKTETSKLVDMHYQEQRLAEEFQQRLHLNPQRAPQPFAAATQHYVNPAQFTDAKRSAVYNKIAKELGRSWRGLGRQLCIGEGEMDEIELRYPQDLKSRIMRLLQTYEEDECHDPRQLLVHLCRALADCGRKDLRKAVEQIMFH